VAGLELQGRGELGGRPLELAVTEEAQPDLVALLDRLAHAGFRGLLGALEQRVYLVFSLSEEAGRHPQATPGVLRGMARGRVAQEEVPHPPEERLAPRQAQLEQAGPGRTPRPAPARPGSRPAA